MFNLARSLDRNADRRPDAEAIVFGGRRLTHAQLLARVNAVAAAFLELGIERGDVIALLLSNRPEFLEAALAANRIGAVFLPLNTRLAEPEVAYIVEHAGATTIVTEPAFATTVQSVGARMPQLRVISVSDDAEGLGMRFASLVEAHEGAIVPVADVRERDLHRLMYTSGTTAHPKGVPVTHGNFLWKTIAHIAEFGITQDDRTAMVGPLYHVGALDLPGIGTWWVGGSLVILPRFDALELLSTIEREAPTNVWLAPAMINALLQEPELGRYDTSSIRFVIGGGEKMPVILIERLLAAFPNARFADAYGLTETVSGDTFLDREHTLSKIGSVGKPVLSVDLRVVRDDESEAAVGESGEVQLRGPKVVARYWNDPDATDAAFTPDGWLRTGDIGHLDDDGYLFIDDRKKDMIVSGGENIATSEVERAIYEHDAILEVAVIGVPDDRWGEVPRAYVVLKRGRQLSTEELIEHCRDRIARFKAPKEVRFLEALPRNPSGKVLKRELRREQDA